MAPVYAGPAETTSYSAPCAGSMPHTASRLSPAHGACLNLRVRSSTAFAPGAMVSLRLNDPTSPSAACRRCQRPGQRSTPGPTPVFSSTVTPAPDTFAAPSVCTATFSSLAPAVSISRCVTRVARLSGTPETETDVEIDGLASAGDGSAHNIRAASARRRGMAPLDHPA